MPFFAERTTTIGTENAFKIGPHIAGLEAKGHTVVKLNLGEPDFSAPQWVKDEVIRQIAADNSHYCDPQGILPLRRAIARQVSARRGLEISPERVCVFPGGKPSIGFAQQIYCDPGDEIIYPSPGFPIYASLIRYVGAVPVPLHLREEENLTFTPEELAALITARTKLIILNFPSNPTGGVATPEQLQAMAQTFEKRRDVIVAQLEAIDGVTCRKPGGAFYLFPNIAGLCERLGAYGMLPDDIRPRTSPATLFQMFALYHHHLAVMGRRSSGAIGADNLYFLRLSIAADLDTLEEGGRRIDQAGQDIEGFQRFVAEGRNLY